MSSSVFSQVVLTKTETIPVKEWPVVVKVNKFRGSIQWQKSIDAINWGDVMNANAMSFSIQNIDFVGYYRAKIVDGKCLPVFSESIRIVNGTLPIVSTLLPSIIKTTSVTCDGKITNNGNLDIIEKGFVWSKLPNPSIGNGKIVSTLNSSTFQEILTGLEINKTYYIRAFASNIAGTAYGEERIFTTYLNGSECTEGSECCQLRYSNLAINALDLTNNDYKKIHDLLYTVDRNNAYHVFVRDPKNFLMWCKMIAPTDILSLTSLDGATHETNHMINSTLEICAPSLTRKYLSFGNIYLTELARNQTTNYSIVEETISENLKSTARYKTYIEGSKGKNGNDFGTLLDELNSYTGGGWFFAKYVQSGLLPKINGYQSSDGELGGMVNFMVYLENYLMSARLNHKTAYETIKKQTTTLSFIQDLWSKGEEVLELSYSYTSQSGTTGMYRTIVSQDYFNAAYSTELLNELDLIGIKHKTKDYWKGTYFK
jgi:hypothetical protein